MTQETSPTRLLAQWQNAGPQLARRDDVVELLRREYRAYEIPIEAMTEEDLANDPGVRENLVDSLWSITHADVIASVQDDEDRTVVALSPDEADEYWMGLFQGADAETPLAYLLLITQHALGQRISVLLEREGEHVTGFTVYGPAQRLQDRLLALVGHPERRPQDPEDGPFMVRGDLEDPVFVEYLRHLSRHEAL